MLFSKPSRRPRRSMLLTVEQLQSNHDAALSQWRLEVERARYEAERAERRYRTVEPENRLVARGWKPNGRAVCAIWPPPKRNCGAASNSGPARLAPSNSSAFRCSAPIFVKSGTRPTTTDRDRKELLRTLLEEVILESQARRRSRASDSALARRRDHDAGCPGPALQADGAAHRRRYHLAASPPGRSLSG